MALAYTEDSEWRNRDEFLRGRDEIVAFLTAQVGARARLRAAQGAVGVRDDRIAVRFQYEWHDATGSGGAVYGNELWEFDADGLMRRREASINDVAIAETDRRIFGPRADGDASAPPLR